MPPRKTRDQKSGPGRDKPGPFYGWYVVAVAFLGNFCAAGTQFYAFNAFMLPLCEARGWTRAEVNMAPILGFLIGLLAQYFYGTVLPKTGLRVLMVGGSLVSAAAFASLGLAPNLPLFYAAFVVLVAGNAAMSSVVANTAVSNWFVKARGRALGVATSGVTLSGVFVPFLAHGLINSLGLAQAFLGIGLGLLVVAPAAILVLKDSPESLGLAPDGRAPGNGPPAASACFPASRLFRQGAFWRLGLSYGLASAGVFAVMFQIGPRFRDLGFSGEAAMLLVAAVAAAGTLGKFSWGVFCDWFTPSRVGAAMFSLVAVGQVFGLLASGPVSLTFFILTFGFGVGGIMSTFPILTAWFFGRASFASVFRFLALFLCLQALGYMAMAASFSLTASYDAAYTVFIFVDVLAAALVFSVDPGQAAADD